MPRIWTKTPRVVVGVDDSQGARWALAWAVGEARLRGLPLLVVHAVRPPRAGYWAGNVPVPSDVATLRRECTTAVRSLLAEMTIPPDMEVTTTCPYGHPGAALTRLAGEGDLLVIGRGARGLLSHLITGSVQRHCARRARATLVVVPTPSLPPLDTSTLENVGSQRHRTG